MDEPACMDEFLIQKTYIYATRSSIFFDDMQNSVATTKSGGAQSFLPKIGKFGLIRQKIPTK
jgi:hypothetical protein